MRHAPGRTWIDLAGLRWRAREPCLLFAGNDGCTRSAAAPRDLRDGLEVWTVSVAELPLYGVVDVIRDGEACRVAVPSHVGRLRADTPFEPPRFVTSTFWWSTRPNGSASARPILSVVLPVARHDPPKGCSITMRIGIQLRSLAARGKRHTTTCDLLSTPPVRGASRDPLRRPQTIRGANA